ncbi:photosystem reaction center subunit H [Halobacteriales archaeon QS_5_70_17]|nr:MAG: photosystem reaction center subunit H [Halobacteriales archaeon QS_5_70_17]
MPEILAENLSGKDVIGDDGATLGQLYNITLDLKTGELHDLVIDPEDGIRDVGFSQNEFGRYLVPVDRVQAVKDHIVVRR